MLAQTAYIYSIPNLNQYTVKIQTKKESFFLSRKHSQIFYPSVEQATKAAQSYGCHHVFLCLENTYNECGYKGEQSRFSCIKIR